jgi:hypothetical protein
MRQDRFLLAILGGIGVLVVVALALFFLRQGKQVYESEATPTGVVHNYVLALQKGDYQRAYRYLADQQGMPDYSLFRNSFPNREELASTAVQFSDEEISGDEAVLNMTMLHPGSGPFNEPFQDVQSARLTHQQGNWKILSVPYPFWGGWPIQLPAPTKPTSPGN